MKKLLFSILILLCQQNGYCQQKNGDTYYKIDNIAIHTEYKNDIPLLVSDLTKHCTTDLEKVRAIFMWITENIEYDYKAFNKGDTKVKYPKHKQGKDYGKAYAKWEDRFLKNIINKRKAVCFGYSFLFKKMCSLAGIQSSIVNGYTKQSQREIGILGKIDHAWNVVIIDNQYYYFDVTWGAGHCPRDKNMKPTGFIKERNYSYWCTPYERMLLNHFPSDPEWIRHTTYINAKEEYKNLPLYASPAIPYFTVISPESGIINAKVGDTIHFKIQVSDDYPRQNQIIIDTNFKPEDNRIKYSSDQVKYSDGILNFDYIIKDKRIRELTIYSGIYGMLSFKVKVK